MHALPESDLRKHLPRNALAETGAWRSPAVILCVTVILAVVLKPLLARQLTPALVFVLVITLIGANSGLCSATNWMRIRIASSELLLKV
jgi:hypothetical protein